MVKNNTVIIRILDKEYQVNCPPEEHAALLRSAQMLDARMREIRKSGHVIGLERIAVMAALNLTYDLMMMESEVTSNQLHASDIERLDDKVSSALDSLEPARPE